MTHPLWTRADVLQACGGHAHGDDWQANGVSIDSRTLVAGDLFVAIKGENSDGHDYVVKALKAGAACALVSDATDAMRDAGALVIVPDALEALNRLGQAARHRTQAKVIAVTGSVGKTSTKEALLMLLTEQGATHASAASYNNLWGVPLSLARMPADTNFGIFEVGMNHAGEITPLTKLVEPDVAMVTTVEPVHMAFFDSVEDIADAKGEIFVGMGEGGTAIINRDNPHFVRLRSHAQAAGAAHIISFGEHEDADARLEKLALKETCSCVSANICGVPVTYKIGVPGRHVVMNSLGILACLHAMKADLAMAALAFARLRAPKGRGERHVVRTAGRTFTVIDESYNANPASMKAALAALAQSEPPGRARRIAILGDMLELGDEGVAMHRGLSTPIKDAGVDFVFASGPMMRELVKSLPAGLSAFHAETSDGLLDALADEIRDGDIIMVKGSLGSRMGPVVEALLSYADDDSESIRRNRGEG